MATMDDIARHLGVSKGTVSKALSGAEDISEGTRKAVLEAAVELGYTRVTRANKKAKICIFIENMAYEKPDDFGRDLVVGFRKMAEPAGYTVDLVPLTNAIQKEMHYDEYMMKHDYKGGFVLGITFTDPWIKEFKTCRTPTVLFDIFVHCNPNVVYVGVDNDEAMDIAIQKLKYLGHKTIGYLSGGLGSYVFQERYLSFFRNLRKNGLNDNRSLAGHAYLTADCIDQHLPRLIKQGCTAIVCSHDLLAHAVMIHCAEMGIKIPEELSIIGIDDLPLCRYTNPPLTSLRQDRTELGKSAYYALSCQINQIHINSLLLHPELIMRDSVGTAKE